MRREVGAHVGETVAETGGLLDRDAIAPSNEVPAHLVDAAGGEADRERAVGILLHRLARV